MEEKYTFTHGAAEVTLSDADGKEHGWFIKSSNIKEVDGKLFWNIKTWENPTRRILTHYVGHAQKKPALLFQIISRTDVIEQLSRVKRATFRRIVSGGTTSNAKRWRTLKSQMKNLLMMPEYAAVSAPDIEGVKGVDINVLSKNALWIELKHESLMYITKAVAAQIDAGGVDKGKRRGKKRRIAESDHEEAIPPHGEEGFEEDGVEGREDEGGESESVDDDVDGLEGNIDEGDAEPVAVHRESVATPKRQSNLFEAFFNKKA